ncbi:hypothetical protein [Rathayibacter sp. AY2B5]|nr:hypothetical protein [Rathayibacter sp. AY2B5]
MADQLNPECEVGKHGACHGDAWNQETDEPADCTCTCHQPPAAAAA